MRGQKKKMRGVRNDMCPLKTTTKVRGKKKERRGVRIEPFRHYIYSRLRNYQNKNYSRIYIDGLTYIDGGRLLDQKKVPHSVGL